MGKAKDHQMFKSDFEILFKDSPEYFLIENAKMLIEGPLVRFLSFKKDEIYSDTWYPLENIFRIKRYYKD